MMHQILKSWRIAIRVILFAVFVLGRILSQQVHAATETPLQISLVPMLTLTTELNMVYRLDYTEQLSDQSHWTFLTNVIVQGSQTVYVDTSAVGNQERFYRATLVSPYTNQVVPPPSINSQPVDVSGIEGANLVISVEAKGGDPLSYQWYQNGLPLPRATNGILELPSIESSTAGQYLVLVRNAGGSTISQAVKVTVLPPVAAPGIQEEPDNLSVYAGYAARLHVTASGMPAPSYQWYRNGAILTETTNRTGTRTPDLLIAKAQSTDAGKYFVVVSNGLGAATSQVAQVTVAPAPILPVITTQPKSQQAKAGTNVTLVVSATGTTPLVYQWFFGATPINLGTNASLVLSHVAVEQSGEYHIVVSNAAGSVSSQSAVITVVEPPRIIQQPIGGEVHSGAAFSLSVEASGGGPLNYQWRKNGSNLTGATNASVHIASAASIDAGTYSVVVKNAAGSITSSIAVVEIITLAPSSLVGQQWLIVDDRSGWQTTCVFADGSNGAFFDDEQSSPFTYNFQKTGDNKANLKLMVPKYVGDHTLGNTLSAALVYTTANQGVASGTETRDGGRTFSARFEVTDRNAHFAPYSISSRLLETFDLVKENGDRGNNFRASMQFNEGTVYVTNDDGEAYDNVLYQYNRLGDNKCRIQASLGNLHVTLELTICLTGTDNSLQGAFVRTDPDGTHWYGKFVLH
jgi:hypothetical protein